MTENVKLLTTKEAAGRLGVCSRTVINLITHPKENYLKGFKHGWAWCIPEDALADYQRRKAAGEAPSVGRPRKPVKIEGDNNYAL